MHALTDNRRSKRRKLIVSMLIGAAVGAAGAAAVVNLSDAGIIAPLTVSQEIALLVAVIYLLMGAGVGFGVVSPQLGAKFLNVEDADELLEERGALVPSALGCLALAFGLAMLALSGSDGPIAPTVALAVFALTLAASVWLSMRSMHNADELMRGVMRDGAAASYYFTFAGLGGWAVLAHGGFVQGPAMLDVVTLFYALTLVGCFWVIGRRGMLVR